MQNGIATVEYSLVVVLKVKYIYTMGPNPGKILKRIENRNSDKYLYMNVTAALSTKAKR